MTRIKRIEVATGRWETTVGSKRMERIATNRTLTIRENKNTKRSADVYGAGL
jgi:hypothetical protein